MRDLSKKMRDLSKKMRDLSKKMRDLSKYRLMIPFSFAVVKVEICSSSCELPIPETFSEQKKMCDQKKQKTKKECKRQRKV